MIVGTAICKILDGLSITYNNASLAVKNNMGNQDALDKFIAESDKQGQEKYPLIFYVTNPVKEFNGWNYCDTDLIIITNTNSDLLYKDRAATTYVPIIEPIYQEAVKRLKSNAYYQCLEANKEDEFRYTDVPNFGITKSEVGTGKSKKSVVTDYVDARIVKIKFRIKTNCI